MGTGDNTIQSGDRRVAARLAAGATERPRRALAHHRARRHPAKSLTHLAAALLLALTACGPDLEHEGAWGQGAATALTSMASLSSARSAHTATLLSDGRVLVVGGYAMPPPPATPSYIPLTSAELYDPATNTWSATGSLAEGRYNHEATRLPDGRVLVTGGRSSPDPVASAEVYDPATGTWSSAGALVTARYFHSATLLNTGKVLVTGGLGAGVTGSNVLASSELYDPATGTWAPTGSLPNIRYSHQVTLLLNGKVLLVGGKGAASATYSSCLLYNPATGTWAATGALPQSRLYAGQTLLPDGRVLVTGGGNASVLLATAVVYNPAAGTWAAAAAMTEGRAFHSATLLPNGRVLLAGGSSTSPSNVQVYDPATGASVTGRLAQRRSGHTTTTLLDGRVLVVGGNGGTVATSEVFDPATGIWASTPTLAEARQLHTATTLDDGRVLIVGGLGPNGPVAQAELADSAINTVSTTGP
ncbi:kelch repeat-containing protein, partial [Pyxidicoccus sp. 3LFB2]